MKFKQFTITFILSVFFTINVYSMHRTYTESGTPLKDKGMNILYDEGFHVLAGTVLTANGPRISIKKLTTTGTIVWSKVFTLDDATYDARCLAIDHNQSGNGYIITGYVDKEINPSVYNNRAYIAEIDQTNGTVNWSKIYAMVGGVGLDIKRTQDGGYVVAGYMSDVMDAFSTYTTGIVFRTDVSGNSSWIKTFDNTTATNTPDYDMAESVFPYMDGPVQKYYITGSISFAQKWYIGTTTFSNETSQRILSAVLDNNGGLVWDNSYTNFICPDVYNPGSNGYSLCAGADAFVLPSENVIVSISNSKFGEGAYISSINKSTGAINTLTHIYETSTGQSLHEFYFTNMKIRHDTVFIWGIATNIYCVRNSTTNTSQNELNSPFELVLTANSSFTAFTPISCKIFRLMNNERQDLESDWLGNNHLYVLSGATSNCGVTRSPIIYTPKIGTFDGSPSPEMSPNSIKWPNLPGNTWFADWEMAVVGIQSTPAIPQSQETYITGLGTQTCHLMQLLAPRVESASPFTYPNNWGQPLISEDASSDFQSTVDYIGATCSNVTAFFECTLKRGSISDYTSINEYLLNNPISLFPNPSSGQVKITIPEEILNLNKSSIRIFDSTGKLILNTLLNESTYQFDLENSGVYYIQVLNANSIIFKDIIVISK